jgi:glycosyltransferase involved in cell wall biosynthesis
MNILFITDCDVYPFRGGIDRSVGVISDSLTRHGGYKCFLFYFIKSLNQQNDPFVNRIQINENDFLQQLDTFIINHDINRIVITTSNKRHTRYVLSTIKTIKVKRNIYVFFRFPQMPGYELASLNLRAAVYRIVHKAHKLKTANKIFLLLLSFMRPLLWKLLRRKYAYICQNTDYVIVLAKTYVEQFAAIAGAPENKFIVINNILPYDTCVNKNTIIKKQKQVLIVARIDEDSKRISLALKMWRFIEQNDCLSEWELVIVGTGDDEDFCKQLAKKLHLQRCFFEGHQNPLDYYLKASIYLMTSSNEGFPVSLVEAQQNGVVPIAFDSFGAVHDIIESGYNGVIVREKNVTEYVKQLAALMKDDERRRQMAINAVESSKRFAFDKIVAKWIELFNDCV